MKNYIHYISVISAGILWGLISLFIKKLNSFGFSSLQIIAFRSFFASVILGIVLLIKDPKLFKIKIKDLWLFVGTGIISLSFFSLCYFTTIIESGASIAVVLLYTSPIFVMIFSCVLFKEGINFSKIFALVATFVGCVFVAGVFDSKGIYISPSGFFIGLCSGVGYALYSIFGRIALKKYNTFTISFYTFFFASLFLVPISNPIVLFSSIDKYSFLFILGIAFLCTFLPYVLYTFGLGGLETSKAAILVTVEPLVGTLLGFFVFREDFNLFKIMGIILIFISLLFVSKE